MNKNTKIALGVGAAAVVGYLVYQNMNAKKKLKGGAGAGTGGGAAVVRPMGTKYGIGVITPEDLANVKSTSTSKFVNAGFRGVDYTDARNTKAANDAYLAANSDLKANWADKDAAGNTVGWSHYVMYGQGEGRTWATDTASFSGNIFA
jgi:hypothetical protein